jgi:TatA/E family protein of Tat protein translocase
MHPMRVSERVDVPQEQSTTMPTPGPLELVIILVIALLILGPGKLPEVGSALGKSIREFRKASADVQDAVKVNVDPTPQPNVLNAQAAPNTPAQVAPEPQTFTQAEVEARVAAAVAAAKADGASTVASPSADSTSTAH